MTDHARKKKWRGAGDSMTGCLPKLCGADIELGNFIQGLDLPGGTGGMASRALLREMPGVSSAEAYSTSSDSTAYSAGYGWGAQADLWGQSTEGVSWGGGLASQDWGRKYLAENGGCVYIDLDHLELCLPEVLSAWDHLACWHAMLRMANEARRLANGRLPEGRKIQVLANNSDGLGHSYGSHTNFLITRGCYNNIFKRKLHQMLFLASYLTSSIVFTGAGKVGSENGQKRVAYQIGQRADFFETLTGPQTTFHRPIVNSRDEALCGDAHGCSDEMARLHVIFFDNTLCHVSSLLRVGVTQIVLTMLEQDHLALKLIVEDPVEAVVRWSHDPGLEAKVRCVSGSFYTAVELQLEFLERTRRFVEAGRADGFVPRAREIVALWEDTLLKLKKRDFEGLAPRLDWVLKRNILERAMSRYPELKWNAAQMKYLDLVYSSLDPEEGLYWCYERAGAVERVVSDQEIDRFVHEPPEDTRAWLRASVLRHTEAELGGEVYSLDWDSIRFRSLDHKERSWSTYTYHTMRMPDPLGFTRQECEAVLDSAPFLLEALESLGLEETDRHGRPVGRTKDSPCRH
jgi:Pup amidohydrolase